LASLLSLNSVLCKKKNCLKVVILILTCYFAKLKVSTNKTTTMHQIIRTMLEHYNNE